MTQEPWLELPEQVVAKIEKVLGVPPSKLADYGLVKLIEDLCDTALMFDREEDQTASPDNQGEQLPRLPPVRPDSGRAPA